MNNDDMKVSRHVTQTRIFDLNPDRITAPVEEKVCINNPIDTSHNVTKPIMEVKEIIPKEKESAGRNEMAILNVRCLKGNYCQAKAILLGTPKSTVTSASA